MERITWKKEEYSENGRAGGIHLFTISYRNFAADPRWNLRSALPGFTRHRWKHDDEEALKLKAEQILNHWLRLVDPEKEE